MKLISVTVGLPRDIIWCGKAVKSSIWKNPVAGRVRACEKLRQGIWSHNGIFHLVDSWPRTGFVSHGFQVQARAAVEREAASDSGSYRAVTCKPTRVYFR